MLPQKWWTKFALTAIALTAFLGGVAYWWIGRSEHQKVRPTPTDHAAALAELRSGNARFVESARTLSTDTVHDAEHRNRTAKEQHPFAAILCCSDSRVCPEFIFDQRTGSIFEIRNAGNVADEDVLASFEYAVEHLHVPLILVLGHKGCGAIHAVCEARAIPLHDHLLELQKRLKGVQQLADKSREKHTPEWLDRMSKENANQQALILLRDSSVLKTAVVSDAVHLVCGIYDMESGAVEFFDPR